MCCCHITWLSMETVRQSLDILIVRSCGSFSPMSNKTPSQAGHNRPLKDSQQNCNLVSLHRPKWIAACSLTGLWALSFYCCDGVTLCLCGTVAGNGPFAQPPDDTWVNMEQRWNDTDRRNRRIRRETCFSATLSSTNLIWTALGANQSLRCKKPATNRLSYSTVTVS
jgi:hypothetical protein